MDKNIPEAIRNSDPKAFETIFFEYFDRIKRFISMLLSSDSEGEELAQDIFVKIWVNRTSFNPDRSVNAYMYTIARNAALNHIKRKKLFTNYAYGVDLSEKDSDTEATVYLREMTLLIDMVLDKMPRQRAEIYRQSRRSGKSNAGIAELLGVSKKTVDNQLSLALKEVRELVEGYAKGEY